jgi:Domain of unknown function (DUF4384)
MSRAGSYLAIFLLASAVPAAMAAPAVASDAKAEDDDTRAVHIIEAPEPPTAPAPLATTPMAPGAANSVAVPLLAPIPPAPKVAAPSPPPASVPTPANPSPLQYPEQRKQAALGAVPINTKTLNSAELSVELLPGLDVAVGARVSFRVTAKKPGYVVLVDVDASGKLTQIYPHPSALAGARPARPNANYVQPGKPLQIPAAGDGYAGLEYVASPPSGVAMIVAILSDRPVQILDLPDVPSSIAGQAEALAYLTKFASELRIPAANGGRMQEARWSFDAKFYAIR